MKCLEDELLDIWYPGEVAPLAVIRWHPEDAISEFNRETAANVWRTNEDAEERWLNTVARAEEVIKARLVEAFTSPSKYLRTYARLLSGVSIERKSLYD